MHDYFETLKLPWLTAEFDYFRLSPEKWELMLARLVQLGVQGVVLTVPWRLHQPAPKEVDLTGSRSARSDLVTVCKLCAALKLPCLLKPGPFYQASGLLNGGRPDWLAAEPDLYDQAFSKAIASWLGALGRTLAQFQYPEGPVVSLWLDFGTDQTAPSQLGNHLKEVRWPIWLRKHYPAISELNAAYNTSYQSVSQVEFPESTTLANPTTALEKDAQKFLHESKQELYRPLIDILANVGWQVPIHPFAANFPALDHYLAGQVTDNPPAAIIILQQPICVSPDPHDVASGPVWASGAPIRSDGSLSRRSWPVRRAAWLHRKVKPDSMTPLVFPVEGGGLVLAGEDTELKIPLHSETKPVAFRLMTSGVLETCTGEIRASRGKLRGRYQVEDATGQTDLIFYLDEPAAPLPEVVKGYLQTLLAARRVALARWGKQAALLADSLTGPPKQAPPPATRRKTSTYTLEEAQRGLQEAEVALRKAVRAIGGLGAGFDSILGRNDGEPAGPVSPPANITAQAFEGPAQETLLAVAEACFAIVPLVKPAADQLKSASESQSLTVEMYRQAYDAAITAAENARNSLLPLITRMRQEMASEQLPLVTWRVHQQLQATTEGLRWGVLSG